MEFDRNNVLRHGFFGTLNKPPRARTAYVCELHSTRGNRKGARSERQKRPGPTESQVRNIMRSPAGECTSLAWTVAPGRSSPGSWTDDVFVRPRTCRAGTARRSPLSCTCSWWRQKNYPNRRRKLSYSTCSRRGPVVGARHLRRRSSSCCLLTACLTSSSLPCGVVVVVVAVDGHRVHHMHRTNLLAADNGNRRRMQLPLAES